MPSRSNGFRFEVQNQEFDLKKDVKSLLVSRLFFVLINKGITAYYVLES